ncbi:MAG: hypothetical protein LBN01_03820 [Endomicrobium sp.]|jgi:hypothetical protein|nr:hypothetical protein [Endomicrobium sp.]
MKEKKKILITVKTYPIPSKKYDETVCTAGIIEDGEWIRLYPIEFRKLERSKQYKKYDLVEVMVEKRTEDFRKESFKPIGICEVIGHIDTKNGWAERKNLILDRVRVYKNISKLISDSKPPDFVSLAVFKPTEILDFKCEKQDPNWSVEENKQLDMFAPNNFKRVEKLPFKFKYIFRDETDRISKLTIIDWETGALFLRCKKKYKEDFKLACKEVKEKYLNDFARNKDLYFFLGTTREHHNTAKNPFLIIGTFHPPKKTDDRQILLPL